MPWVAPVRRSVQGDIYDSPAYTSTFTIQANAGDLIAISITCSHQALVLSSVSGGDISFVVNAMRERAASTANAYVISGISPITQTFTLTVQLSNYVNTSQYYSQTRVYVFGSHGGVGYAGAWRGSGEPWLTANQSTERSAFIHCHVDWNATAANGSWLLDAGPVSDAIVYRGGAAIYWAASHLDSVGINQKNLGANGSSSTKFSGAALEIKGIYVDTDPPSAVSSVAATPLNDTQIRVDWGAATDDIGVTGYRIYNFGTLVAQVGSDDRSYTHSGLSPETSYQYTVRAFDAGDRLGGVIESANATTFAASVNRMFAGITKPSLRLGTTLVKKVYKGSTQIWP